MNQGLGSASSYDEEYTFRVEVPSKVSAPFVPLEINGVTCKFLVDSGASVNIISRDMSNMIGIKLQSIPSFLWLTVKRRFLDMKLPLNLEY